MTKFTNVRHMTFSHFDVLLKSDPPISELQGKSCQTSQHRNLDLDRVKGFNEDVDKHFSNLHLVLYGLPFRTVRKAMVAFKH